MTCVPAKRHQFLISSLRHLLRGHMKTYQQR